MSNQIRSDTKPNWINKMNPIKRIKLDLRNIEKRKQHATKGRWIPNKYYSELKQRKKCQRCKKQLKGFPEIHHRIPIKKGGKHNRENLMALCKECHKILDSKD